MTPNYSEPPRARRHQSRHRKPGLPAGPVMPSPAAAARNSAAQGGPTDIFVWLRDPAHRWSWYVLGFVALLILCAVLSYYRHPGKGWQNDWPVSRQPRF